MADIPAKSDGSSSGSDSSDSYDPIDEIAEASFENQKDKEFISEEMWGYLENERDRERLGDAKKSYHDYFQAARDLGAKLWDQIGKRDRDKDWMRGYIEQLRTWAKTIDSPAILNDVNEMMEALIYNDIGEVKSALQTVEFDNNYLYLQINRFFEGVGAGAIEFSEESQSEENSSEESSAESD